MPLGIPIPEIVLRELGNANDTSMDLGDTNGSIRSLLLLLFCCMGRSSIPERRGNIALLQIKATKPKESN